MELQEVLRLYNSLKGKGIKIWIDGGWGIDALLGYDSRAHDDLDIALDRKDEKIFRDLISSLGYVREIKRDDASAWNYVLADDSNHKLDVHIFEFDEHGKHIYGTEYVKESLKGKGVIGGQEVNCITPEWVVKYHEVYTPDEQDRKDMDLLCKKFNLGLPKNY